MDSFFKKAEGSHSKRLTLVVGIVILQVIIISSIEDNAGEQEDFNQSQSKWDV